jgi:hypothetical protein
LERDNPTEIVLRKASPAREKKFYARPEET